MQIAMQMLLRCCYADASVFRVVTRVLFAVIRWLVASGWLLGGY